jgi:signal transduction histidine kinase
LGYLAVAGRVPGFNLEAFGGGPRAGHNDAHLWTAAFLMTAGVGLGTMLGRQLRGVFDSMLSRALDANEQLRREHAERSRELVALSGEIAHELKNPMSSVKGLSALLAQNMGEEGKGASA